MKVILIAIFTIISFAGVNAQVHNLSSNFNCKLQKKGYFFNSEKHACPACQKTEEKEKVAKQAEDKRREDAFVAKKKAENDTRQKARELKKIEDKKNEHSGEVTIEMPKNNAVAKNNPTVKNNENRIKMN
jgi:hypothetical protein